jgi:hypothetical protein
VRGSLVRIYGIALAALVALAAALAVQVLVVLAWPGTSFDLNWQFEFYCAFVACLAASVMSTHIGGEVADATLAALAMALVTYLIGILLYPIATSIVSGGDAFGYQWPLALLITVPLLLILVLPSAVWVLLLRFCLARYQRSS